MDNEMIQSVKLFPIYASEDKSFWQELNQHFANLKRKGLLTILGSQEIYPGTDVQQIPDPHIMMADLIVFLVSPHFFNPNFLPPVEIKHILQKYEAGELQAVSVVIQSVDWSKSSLKAFPRLPGGGKPVSAWVDRDEAWQDCTASIGKLIQQLLASKNR